MTSKVIYKGDLRTRCVHLKSDSMIETDAPTDNNGKGEAFSPTDLVATALASCMITVMGIKAAANNIHFERVQAEVTKTMDSAPRRIAEIRVNFLVEEKWTANEKKIMENTARNCPVTHSLHANLKQTVTFTYK